MWTRRRFVQAGAAALGGALGVGLYTWRIEPHWVQFVRRPLRIARLPSSLQGAALVQLSDLHVGPRVDSGYITRVLRRVAALRPDIVVFTGDFITYRGAGVFDELARVLEHVPHGRLGTVAVLGNHDYGYQWRRMEVAAAVEERARDAGLTVLRNSTTLLGGLRFVGLDDLWGPNFQPGSLVTDAAGQGPTVVLAHNPDSADRDVWGEFQGWILSGHTHGGQCKPPFLPPPLLPVVNRAYTAGEIALDDGRAMYINRGVGHLLRVRFNVRPEVTVFTLESSTRFG